MSEPSGGPPPQPSKLSPHAAGAASLCSRSLPILRDFLLIYLVFVTGLVTWHRMEERRLGIQARMLKGYTKILLDQLHYALQLLAREPRILDESTPPLLSRIKQSLDPMGVTEFSTVSIEYSPDGTWKARLHKVEHEIDSDDLSKQEHLRRLVETHKDVSSLRFKPVERDIEDAIAIHVPVLVDDKVEGSVFALIDLEKFRKFLAGGDAELNDRLRIYIDGWCRPGGERCEGGISRFSAGASEMLSKLERTWRFQVLGAPTRWFWVFLLGFALIAAAIAAVLAYVRALERERKQAALERARAIKNYEVLVESMESAVIIWGQNGKISFANPFACRFFDYPREQLVGANLYEKLIPPSDEQHRDVGAQVRGLITSMESGDLKPNINENVRRDGERVWVAWSNRAIPSPDGGALSILSVGNDITELKQAEKQLLMQKAELASLNAEMKKARDRAEEASRQKSAFLYRLSHELRTPLNAVCGYSTELLRDSHAGTLGKTEREYVGYIQTGGKLLLALIDDLLDLSKIEANKLDLRYEDLRIEDILAVAIAIMTPQIHAAGLSLRREVTPGIGLVRADRQRCHQILQNLLSNALKFSPPEAAIVISASCQEGFARFEVRDRGPGIAPELQPGIFTEYYQADRDKSRAAKGTGIGLALSRRLVELQGGRIGFESSPEEGTTFYFTLPLVPLRVAGEPSEVALDGGGEIRSSVEASVERSLAPPRRRRILVAEDDDRSLDLLRNWLSVHDHIVTVARDGKAALERATATQPEIILMDIWMPEMDGLEATRQLRAMPEFRDTPIIATTAYAGTDMEAAVLAAGCTAYLTKPIDEQALYVLLAKHLSPR